MLSAAATTFAAAAALDGCRAGTSRSSTCFLWRIRVMGGKQLGDRLLQLQLDVAVCCHIATRLLPHEAHCLLVQGQRRLRPAQTQGSGQTGAVG